ncbi:endoribonuclease Dicer homolog 2-like isoform X3 [Magnolia sinica]|uniref:endoribonuclease Dicer homolog 2-like isoform X3 n=1 Tax=Magnolia sinica TaxID=86752 RepID=UPI0026581067|nr:endoribonuclease Dicer homolog 2-like isoform X3 [Magnolia sinica]
MEKEQAFHQRALNVTAVDATSKFPVEDDDDVKERDAEQLDYFPEELVSRWVSFSEMGSYHYYSLGLAGNGELDVPFRGISLIVKCDLGADFATTQFQLARGSVTVNVKYVGPIHLTTDQVNMARRFQITILRSLINHKWRKLRHDLNGPLQEEGTLATTTYLVLPSIDHDLVLPSIDPDQNSSFIDWDCIKSASFSSKVDGMVREDGIPHCCSLQGDNIRWMHIKDSLVCSCMLRNSLVTTPHTKNIYCISGILDDLSANSPMKSKKGEVLSCTYKEHFRSRGITLHYEGESLLCGRHLSKVQNWLRRSTFQKGKGKGSPGDGVELPPELCEIIMSPISTSTLHSFSFIPSIMHRIKSMLLAITLKAMQMNHCMRKFDVPAIKVLEAIMTDKCEEEFSLESLETLGDSFLKYVASQQLFRDNKQDREGPLTHKRESIISNANLCKLGCSRKLPGFIRNERFDPKQWVIPGDPCGCYWKDEMFVSPLKKIYYEGTRPMNSKVISDVVEALIGAYLSTSGELAALYFMKWLGLEVDFVNEISLERPFLAAEKYVNISSLQSLLKYSFRDPSLLVEALTHGSYQLPDIPGFCYQRLEFLGDSVLDYLITLHFFKEYPGISPEVITDLRSASVNNECYALISVKFGLYKHILHQSPGLDEGIMLFVNSFGQSLPYSTFGWKAKSAFPRPLADILESIAGAILVDSGFDKNAVWESIRPLLEPMATPDTLEQQPVRELEELRVRRSYEKPTFQDGVASITADGIIHEEAYVSSNKKTSAKIGAEALLGSLKMGKEKYHVVLVGRRPGIYDTWEEARVEVEGYSGGKHRAFRNWKEAVACWDNFFRKACEPSRPLPESPCLQVAAASAEMEIQHATTSFTHQSTQMRQEVVERATSTDDPTPSDSEKVIVIFVGVLVLFFSLLIIIKF